MKMLNNELENQFKEVFTQLTDNVTIALFTDSGSCSSCEETKEFMEELVPLSEKLNLVHYTLEENDDLAKRFNVTMVPSIVLLDKDLNYKGVKFNGIPAGHEINAFIPALLEVSGTTSDLPEDLTKVIESFDKPVNIKVFVTLACPHCSGAVQKAHKLALMNENIDAEMIEAQTFMEISNKFNVSGVPKIVINDQYELVGNQPIQAFIDEMQKIS
jgi:glutaredoxin-like protein